MILRARTVAAIALIAGTLCSAGIPAYQIYPPPVVCKSSYQENQNCRNKKNRLISYPSLVCLNEAFFVVLPPSEEQRPTETQPLSGRVPLSWALLARAQNTGYTYYLLAAYRPNTGLQPPQEPVQERSVDRELVPFVASERFLVPNDFCR